MSKASGWERGKADLAAAARQGHKELAQILPAFPAQGVQPVEEPGTFGNPTQREVYEMKFEDHLDAKAADADRDAAKGKDRSMDRS